MATLQGTALGNARAFNWIELVSLLISGILAIFFLFYFNRLFATVLSYAIRAWTWHKYRAYVDITALQVSLLGGRVFFKSIRYHAHNMTVLVHDGQVSWRYWLTAVQKAEVFEGKRLPGHDKKETSQTGGLANASSREGQSDDSLAKEETGLSAPAKKLPCRILVKVSGVEAFIYNRSPAYDAILAAATKRAASSNDEPYRSGATRNPFPQSKEEVPHGVQSAASTTAQESPSFSRSRSTSDYPTIECPLPSWLSIFPIAIRCKRAAAAIGNQHTTSVITAKIDGASGTVDAGRAGLLDAFKLLFNFDLENVQVLMKPNHDYRQPQLQYAETIRDEIDVGNDEDGGAHAFFSLRSLSRILGISKWSRKRKPSAPSIRISPSSSFDRSYDKVITEKFPGQPEWEGLARYLDFEEDDLSNEWADIEYAKSSTIVDCPKVGFHFHWDIPGRVPHQVIDSTSENGSILTDDINGSTPPEYGIEIAVHGGTIAYGPWADRQRVNLQHVFFPASAADATPFPPLKGGDWRISTVFEIRIIIEDDVVLRVPTRQSSRDSDWRGRAKMDQSRKPANAPKSSRSKKRRQSVWHKSTQSSVPLEARPYSWLDITVKADTTVNYTMDMFCRAEGFRNHLDIDLKGSEMASSVNHGLLWRAGALTLDADISNPCSWNSLRKWPFRIVCHDLELFILRDHMFLITDIIDDWSMGPPPNFYTFVSFVYNLDLTFHNFTLFLNTNDGNIISNPAELEYNDFLKLGGRTLQGKLEIPLQHYRPVHSGITFDVCAQDIDMQMSNPVRSTLRDLVPDKNVAKLQDLVMFGSYSSQAGDGTAMTDILQIDITGKVFDLKAHGFVVRHLINVKENYFGEHLHFRTAEEFQGSSDTSDKSVHDISNTATKRMSNELDVILCINVEDAGVTLPTNIYCCSEFIRAELPAAKLDLRIGSYYLDMSLSLTPISLLTGSSNVESSDGFKSSSSSSTQLWISHVELFGHRAFGLPPAEPAYVCTWDVDIGSVLGECGRTFTHNLVMAGNAFLFTFQDKENVLPLPPPSALYDVTFARVRTDIVKLWVHAGEGAILVQMQPITVDTNDWNRQETSQRIDVLLPLLTFACIAERGLHRVGDNRDGRAKLQPVAFIQTGASIAVIGRASDFEVKKANQQDFLRQQDSRTDRAPFLLVASDDVAVQKTLPGEVDPPLKAAPKLPLPLDRYGVPREDARSIRSNTLGSTFGKFRDASRASLAASLHQSSDRQPDSDSFAHGDERTSKAEIPVKPSITKAVASTIISNTTKSSSRKPEHVVGQPRTVLSSSFLEPYFPLVDTTIDDSHVPDFVQPFNKPARSTFAEMDGGTGIEFKEAATTSILLEIIPGIRGHVDIEVATLVLSLLESLLPSSADELLDAFHMEVMGQVSDRTAGTSNVGTLKVLELHALLPAAHFRVTNTSDDDRTALNCDVIISRFTQIFRTRSQGNDETRDTLTLRSSVDRLQIDISASMQASHLSGIARIAAEDVSVWLNMASSTAAHLAMRTADINVAGDHVDSIVYTVLSILPLVEDLTARASSLGVTSRNLLLTLVQYLTATDKDSGDPPFLSRMIFTLRAYPAHFRNQDSWKIISRLRFMLATSNSSSRTELSEAITLKDDVPNMDEMILDIYDWMQWRNWDIPDIGQTTAIRMLTGRGDPIIRPKEEKAVSAGFTSETLRLAISRGEGCSQIVLNETSLETDSRPPTAPTGLLLVEENMRRFTVTQVVSGEILVSLDWSLVELAHDITRFEPEFRKHSIRFPSPDSAQSQEQSTFLPRHDFQIVVLLEKAALSGGCRNLRYSSHASGIRMSLIGTSQLNDEYSHCESALVNADAAFTELHGAHSCIWQTSLTLPSLYVDRREPAKSMKIPPAVNLAFAYKSLDIQLRDQIPGILQVVDSLILDEVQSVLSLVAALQSPSSNQSVGSQVVSSSASSIDGIREHPRISIAILAGRLHMQVSLLHALAYHLEGDAASIRIAPHRERHGAPKFHVNFDVGRQSHSFVSSNSKEKHRQGIFELPPVNGQVELETTSQNINVSAAVTVGRVEVEAIALQNVVAVVNRDEVQQVLSAIKTGIDDIVHDVGAIQNKKSFTPSSSAVSRPVIYEIRLASLGVRVAASTSHGDNHTVTNVDFGVGSVHLRASNRETFSIRNPFIPAIKASIRDIGARLWTQRQEQSFSRGSVVLAMEFKLDTRSDDDGRIIRDARLQSDGINIDVFPETAATIIDVLNHLQDKIRDLDLSKEVEYLRHLRDARRHKVIRTLKRLTTSDSVQDMSFSTTELLAATTTMLQLNNIQIVWHVATKFLPSASLIPHDAVITLVKVEFTTKGANEARLQIVDLMLQLVPRGSPTSDRHPNSALLPEVTFSVAYWADGPNGKIACKSSGRALDLQLDSRFLLPANGVQRSIEHAVSEFRLGTATWKSTPTSTGTPRRKLLDTKRLVAILVEADFEGAQVHLQGSTRVPNATTKLGHSASASRSTQRGRYGQFGPETGMTRVTLKSPGIAFKMQYNAQQAQSVVHGQLRIDASNNSLLPDVVPLILDISDSIKEVVRKPDDLDTSVSTDAGEPSSSNQDLTMDPEAIFGKTKVDFGLRICRQEFGLSCQPIARIDAKAVLEDVYFTINTIDSNDELGHFYAVSAVVTKLTAQVKHTYSREPTFNYDMESIVLSLMNSKHLQGKRGISAILKLAPTKISINAKQLQDLLLFREIWLPTEIRQGQATDMPAHQNDYVVQKYQLAAAAASFPWNVTVAVAQLAVELDLGQSIGKSSFTISNLWAHQQKSSNWEQDLCIGMEKMAVDSAGRMSGFVELDNARVRMSISWPRPEGGMHLTPLIQASMSFKRLRTKAAFDYQAFAFGDIEDFDFVMYNVRQASASGENKDRLVALLDFGKAFVFCTSTSAAQALGLQQAFERLIQEKQAAYAQSLKDIEKHLRRESVISGNRGDVHATSSAPSDTKAEDARISLHTNVVLGVRTLSVGVFPSTFFDSQLLKLEANNIEARFSVGLEHDQIVCRLGLDLGHLQAALASVRKVSVVPKSMDIGVDEVINSAMQAKGGTILRVPRVEADMHTWQHPNRSVVEYTFDSLFDGKIDVGWNLSRINYIQSMWTTHARSLAVRLGKAPPEAAVKITTAGPSSDATDEKAGDQPQEKIMAEVSLPQFRYDYRARRPSVIATPQLRDLGEATPPLEWIGLNRDRLPNVTHQVVIVSLLGVAREVGDAYERILGSSAR